MEIKIINNNKFDCALCGNTHVKNNQDFPINQALKNFKKLNFSSKFPQLKIQKIDSIILPLEDTIDNMESKIMNYCDGLRFQVDLKTDSSIENLNKAREEFLGQIKEFEIKKINDLHEYLKINEFRKSFLILKHEFEALRNDFVNNKDDNCEIFDSIS